MSTRIVAFFMVLVTGVLCFAKPNEPLDKQKQTVIALFDGLPMDLRSKIKDNPVRCDRVNDWLKDNVADKGKSIEINLAVERVNPVRDKDGMYDVQLAVQPTIIGVLDSNWVVNFSDHGISSREYQFYFSGVTPADAEKLADSKHVKIQGKVKSAYLSRFPTPQPNMRIVLEDVLVDGKKWNPYSPKGPKFGKFPIVPDDGKTKKGKGKQ